MKLTSLISVIYGGDINAQLKCGQNKDEWMNKKDAKSEKNLQQQKKEVSFQKFNQKYAQYTQGSLLYLLINVEDIATLRSHKVLGCKFKSESKNLTGKKMWNL